MLAAAWLRGEGAEPVDLPTGEWRDVLDERTRSGCVTVAELCAGSGIALLERAASL